MKFFLALKEPAKKWVRPFFIPIVRPCVRYLPQPKVRRAIWRHLVAPFLQHADRPYVANTVFGATIAGNTADLIQRYIFYFGIWEPNLTAFVTARLKKGDVFVDVGANIGYFTLLASRLVGSTGRVVAIEASPRIFERLLDNLRRNAATNVEAINLAVSDCEGITSVFFGPDSNIGKTSIVARSGAPQDCEIVTRPLNSILAPEDIAGARLIKIDVEGAEWLVISGMRDLLRHGRPDLEVVVEISPQALQAHGKSIEDFVAVFSEAGFFPYRIENDYSAEGYMSDRAIKRPERITAPILSQTDVVFSRKNSARL